jgi:hypothetical protein
MIEKKLSNHSENKLHSILTLLGMLLACVVIYIQHGWINDDSVLYFEMARLFTIGEWKQGASLFSWPFYPALISVVHRVSSLSIQTSAQLLNVIFFGITTYSFARLIQLAGGKKSTIICGAFLLFSSTYIVGDVLPMLLRDQGFWAMFLTSLVCFIQYYREHKIKHALLWQLFAILAFLFRVEAIAYLVFLPFVLFFNHQFTINQRFKHFLIINIFCIFGLLGILGALLFSPNLQLSDFGRLQETITIFPKILANFTTSFKLKADIMGEKVLGSFFDEYGKLGLFVSLISILIAKIISMISLPVIGVFALSKAKFANKTKTILQADVRRIFIWVMWLAIINAALIMISQFLLSSRYIIALGFMVLILASFKLDYLLQQFSQRKLLFKISFAIIMVALCLSFFRNMLPKGAGYNFEQDAVAYLKQQQVPNNKVFFVTPRARYFAGADYTERGYEYWDYTQKAITNGKINQYDYLLLNIDVDAQYAAKQQYLSQQLTQYKLEKEFYGYKKKKKVMLYIKQ